MSRKPTSLTLLSLLAGMEPFSLPAGFSRKSSHPYYHSLLDLWAFSHHSQPPTIRRSLVPVWIVAYASILECASVAPSTVVSNIGLLIPPKRRSAGVIGTEIRPDHRANKWTRVTRIATPGVEWRYQQCSQRPRRHSRFSMTWFWTEDLVPP